ncbi:leukocyte tyrosine kinase receptor-like isoform X1 [Centruroides sculpturatus]|uniref:leukocyte tyrosine kinase receptor-like isoform X1 n=1 Tax=Centruroides sculpturatus TaxID=218467 RepID=UPI000C6C9251|nr:leukocyte tyrosine kinase receptor-like isoform X1 [Centruroides sculpturatus]
MKTILLVLSCFSSCLAFDCDFETSCSWKWHINDPISIVSALNLTDDNFIQNRSLNDTYGNFLYYGVAKSYYEVDVKRINISSPWFVNGSGHDCTIDFDMVMRNMEDGYVEVYVETERISWVIARFAGNSLIDWKHFSTRIGTISKPFHILLEISPPNNSLPVHVAIDNLKLDGCLRTASAVTVPCEPHHFRCSQGTCIEKEKLCDLIFDCPDGEDEKKDCDLMPFGSRCNFEMNMCGWTSNGDGQSRWIRNNGSVLGGRIGPHNDHTYENETGIYIIAKFPKKYFGHNAVLRSVRFRPPPRYHRSPSSSFYQSCKVRFYYYIHGKSPSVLSLRLNTYHSNYPDGRIFPLWSASGKRTDFWNLVVLPLPDILDIYDLEFRATNALRQTIVALDDISLTPECFEIGAREDIANVTDYLIEKNSSKVHTKYVFSTCGIRGNRGPTEQDCRRSYKNSSTRVSIQSKNLMDGIQQWVVPQTNIYTVFAGGASGGQGLFNKGKSRGAVVRASFNWTAEEVIFILVGQKGTSACSISDDCDNGNRRIRSIEELQKLKRKKDGGGGGGGGATYVFKIKNGGKDYIPLVVASGGGGLAHTRDDNSETAIIPEGRGEDNQFGPSNGFTLPRGAGGGGGWNDSTHISRNSGLSLLSGGFGGYPCQMASSFSTSGGFGGGGGACYSGGGGGGYKGGNAAEVDEITKNGQGGTSFVSSLSILPLIEPGMNEGDGFLQILPAQSDCGCQYLCIVIDMTEITYQCICPEGSSLEDDGTSCKAHKEHLSITNLVVIILSCLVVLTVVGFISILALSKYRKKQSRDLSHEPLNNPEMQLSRLRQSGGGMVTEYNPNYEFGGSACTIQDLREIPRDSLTLVKALGQGAFGEVYQGYLSDISGELGDMPVAVKTLPELSSNQAEMDFFTEALIMSKFNHPNIVRFVGVCFEKLPRFIVLELLSGGDLKSFLRESRPKPNKPSPLNMSDLLHLALDVAKGCQYLEENHFIHRDIAARNCLLTTKGVERVVKIADFGMARDIYRADYYRKGGKAMLPVKWMPPEAFLDGIFTCKTDVWSFGVLLWEVMSLGYMPYPGRGNQDVMQMVTSGGRLEAPTNCPNPVYHIMMQCWHPVPDQRPCFSTVIERIGYCLQDPDVLRASLPVFHRPPSMERDATVMRPPDTDSICLQVQRPDRDMQSPGSEDYLIPMPSSNYSLSTERTELQTSSAESVDKLLEINDTRRQETNDNQTWETSFVCNGNRRRKDGYNDDALMWCEKPNVERVSSLKSLDSLPLAPSLNHVGKNSNDVTTLDAVALNRQMPTLPIQYVNVDVNSNSQSQLDVDDQNHLNHNLLDNYSCTNPAVSSNLTNEQRVNC